MNKTLRTWTLLDYTAIIAVTIAFMLIALPTMFAQLGDAFDEIVDANQDLQKAVTENAPFGSLQLDSQIEALARVGILWLFASLCIIFATDWIKMLLIRKSNKRFFISWILKLFAIFVLGFLIVQITTVFSLVGVSSNNSVIFTAIMMISIWLAFDLYLSGWLAEKKLKRMWLYAIGMCTIASIGFIPILLPFIVALLIAIQNSFKLRAVSL